VRRDLALGEVAHQLAEGLLLVGELHVHAGDGTTAPNDRAAVRVRVRSGGG
jgi:hypothetical protein